MSTYDWNNDLFNEGGWFSVLSYRSPRFVFCHFAFCILHFAFCQPGLCFLSRLTTTCAAIPVKRPVIMPESRRTGR